MRKQNFFKHLDACAINWDYFTNFNTLSKLEVFKNEILALEPLLVSNENEIEDKVVSIVSLYPKSVDVLLLMIAIRRNKLSQLKIESSAELGFKYDKLLSDTIDYDELLAFFRESGLKELFLSRKIVHLKSYLMGAEIGLDSNARKNRSGNLMANKCESILENYCNHNRFKGYRETTLKRYGINLDKQFDYLVVVIFDAHFDVKEAYLIPHNIICQYARYNKHQNGYILVAMGRVLEDANVINLTTLFR